MMTFRQRLDRKTPPKVFVNPEYALVAITDDEDEDVTKPDHPTETYIGAHVPRIMPGPIPQAENDEHSTAERCVVCWRPPGEVLPPGSQPFDHGVKHTLARLTELMMRHGIPKDEADAIVARLRAADVELP